MITPLFAFDTGLSWTVRTKFWSFQFWTKLLEARFSWLFQLEFWSFQIWKLHLEQDSTGLSKWSSEVFKFENFERSRIQLFFSIWKLKFSKLKTSFGVKFSWTVDMEFWSSQWFRFQFWKRPVFNFENGQARFRIYAAAAAAACNGSKYPYVRVQVRT